MFFLKRSGHHRELHELTHSFPTRRSSDLTLIPKPASLIEKRLHLRRHGAEARRKAEDDAIILGKLIDGRDGGFLVKLKAIFLRDLFRSEEHTSELQSLMRISYAVFCLKQKNHNITQLNSQIRHTTL